MSGKFFKIWFGIVATLAILAIVGSIVVSVLIGSAAYKVASEANDNGIKSVVDRLWCGEKGCAP